MNTSAELESAYAAFEAEDYASARAIFERLESEHCMRAHLYLGWMCDRGLGGFADSAKAEYHFRCLAEAGDLDGKYYLAASLHRRGEVQSAVALYEEAADSGHVSAAYWAYALYSKELIRTVGAQEKAQKYLAKASDLGHIFARRDLAFQVAKSGKSFGQRFLARLRYLACKAGGFIIIIKNSEDLRIR
jgi:TPR repeat protein